MTASSELSRITEPAYSFWNIYVPGGDTVADIQASGDWYKAMFGVLEVARFGVGSGRSLGLALKFGKNRERAMNGSRPAIGIAANFVGPPGAPGKDEFARFSFNVTQAETLRRRAAAFGGEVVSVSEAEGSAVTVLRDSFGNFVELVSPANESQSGDVPEVWWRAARIPATDPELTARFFCEVLEMEQLEQTHWQGASVTRLTFPGAPDDHPPLEIVKVDHLPRPVMTTNATHLVFRCSDFDAMASAMERTYRMGGEIRTHPHYVETSGVTYCHVHGPDGTRIEFVGKYKAPPGLENDMNWLFMVGPADH